MIIDNIRKKFTTAVPKKIENCVAKRLNNNIW